MEKHQQSHPVLSASTLSKCAPKFIARNKLPVGVGEEDEHLTHEFPDQQHELVQAESIYAKPFPFHRVQEGLKVLQCYLHSAELVAWSFHLHKRIWLQGSIP